jgi:hypothetical protein
MGEERDREHRNDNSEKPEWDTDLHVIRESVTAWSDIEQRWPNPLRESSFNDSLRNNKQECNRDDRRTRESGECILGRHETSQHETSQHETSQHETSQHETSQHETSQHNERKAACHHKVAWNATAHKQCDGRADTE